MEKDIKQGIIEKFQRVEGDTGSPEVQIALLSARISHLTEHLKIHKKDSHSKHGLIKMIGKRSSLINYLKKKDIAKSRLILKELGVRDKN